MNREDLEAVFTFSIGMQSLLLFSNPLDLTLSISANSNPGRSLLSLARLLRFNLARTGISQTAFSIHSSAMSLVIQHRLSIFNTTQNYKPAHPLERCAAS